jgi:hypothetical protein
VSDVERRREERKRLRAAKRELAAHERHLIRTTRVRTIAVPIGRMAELFAEIQERNEDFQYQVTGDDTMRAWIGNRIPVVVQQLGAGVALRFEPAAGDATRITATVPDVEYLLGNGHLLNVDVILKFIQEGAERWNTPSS